MSTINFKQMAQDVCNGCDLVTTEENKLSTDDVVAMKTATLEDFALCTIDGKKVGVVTFVEKKDKYYWGGQALTNMVVAFVDAFAGDETAARSAYEAEKTKVKLSFEMTKTKAKQDFLKVTVM